MRRAASLCSAWASGTPELVYAGVDGGPPKAVKLRTGAGGEGSFKITQPGKWYVTLINMEKATGEAHYESNWSTLTFEVR